MVFKRNVPLPGDNLSTSQGDLYNNTNDSDTSFGINHYSFSNLTTNNGKHKMVEMPVSTVIPAGLAAGEATFYSKTVTGESNMFFTPDNSTNEYQITTAKTAQFATFGDFVASSVTNSGGWTFLPGGLIMQYGKVTGTQTVTFPFPFTTAVYSVTSNGLFIQSTTLAGFSFPVGTIIGYWIAIGK